MPRMLRRAAVLGATAHVASNRGEAKAEQAQQQAAAAAPPAAPAPAAAPAPVEAAPPVDTFAELTKLKELLDSGILTQAEFDAQKAKILNA